MGCEVKLIHDWRAVLARAWSVRLILLAGLFSGLEVAVALLNADLLGMPPGTFAALAGLVTFAALVSRFIAQKSLGGFLDSEDGSLRLPRSRKGKAAAGAALAGVIALGGVPLESIRAEQHIMTSGWEGTRYVVYLDSGGVPTTCTGHTGPEVKMGQVYTGQQCIELFEKDFHEKVDLPLSRCLRPPQSLPPEVVVALRDFAFNVGGGAACSSTLMKLLNAGKTREACEQFSRWVFVKRTFVQGLKNRRDVGQRGTKVSGLFGFDWLVSERTLCLAGLE